MTRRPLISFAPVEHLGIECNIPASLTVFYLSSAVLGNVTSAWPRDEAWVHASAYTCHLDERVIWIRVTA